VAVIVVESTVWAQDVKTATRTIPIVFMAGGDPVEFGLVSSLSRPGANVTGVTTFGIDLTGKRLEMLHRLVPAASIAALAGSGNSQFVRDVMLDLHSAALALGERVLVVNAANENEIARAFATLVDQHAGALLISAGSYFQQARNQIISLAARHALPTMFLDSASAAAGALSSYGPDFPSIYHQAGVYTGRILKGEKPADLPVVQPTKLEFVINLQTAKQLGLEVPPSLLAIADRVIE
jgi:putative ABC transport system substrate-binding protein